MNKWIKRLLIVSMAAALILAGIDYVTGGSEPSSTVAQGGDTGKKETEKPKETEKAAEKPTEAPTEKVTEKPTEKPTEKVTEKATEKPTEAVTEAGKDDEESKDKNSILEAVGGLIDYFKERLSLSSEGKSEDGRDEPEVTEATEATEAEKTHTYELCKADISWSSAKKLAESKGGYLAIIETEKEFDAIVTFIKEQDLAVKYVWVGGHDDGSNNYVWDNGEAISYDRWYSGEPSFIDKEDKAIEDCLALWDINKEWSFNDQRDNLPTYGEYVLGKIGYLIEYEK